MNNLWYPLEIDCYSVIKQIELLIFITTWTDLKRGQTWKATYRMIPFTWDVLIGQFIKTENKLSCQNLKSRRVRESLLMAQIFILGWWQHSGIRKCWYLANFVSFLKLTELCIVDMWIICDIWEGKEWKQGLKLEGILNCFCERWEGAELLRRRKCWVR